jgi:hypothetical protein
VVITVQVVEPAARVIDVLLGVVVAYVPEREVNVRPTVSPFVRLWDVPVVTSNVVDALTREIVALDNVAVVYVPDLKLNEMLAVSPFNRP